MTLWAYLAIASVVSTIGWVMNNWIKARHGYPIPDDEQDRPSKRKMEAICAENGELKQHVAKLEQRLAVLERIATDPAERTAREIDALR